jgi:putative alpha-1,2-mannosidase
MPDKNKIIGYTTHNNRGVPQNFKNYFVIHCDKPFTLSYTWHDSVLVKDSLVIQANHAGGIVGFKTNKGETIHLKVGFFFY